MRGRQRQVADNLKRFSNFGITDLIFYLQGFPTINVNIIGLVLGVVGIFGTAFLLPLLTKSHSVTDPNIRYGKCE